MKSLLAVALVARCAGDRVPAEPPMPPGARELRITHGSAGAPSLRAVAPDSRGDRATLRFVYHGRSAEVAPLASGDTRSQLGLKLRAADSCNVLYVMWRIEPSPAIVVQLKHNPGLTEHEQCGATGYTRIRPSARRAPAPMTTDREHTLSAAIDGDELLVWADHVLAWRGTLPAQAREVRGPAGVRTDNVRADLELHAD